MYRGRTLTLSFPPFTFWVKRIIIASVVIYFLQVLLGAFLPLGGRYFELYAGLVPGLVIHYGMIWQLLTYSFLHGSVGHVLINMLMRSEEHTSELQSLTNLVCRLLLEKKKNIINENYIV